MRRTLLVPFSLLVLVFLADPASAKGPSEAVLDGEGMAEPVDLRQTLGDQAFWEETRGLGSFAALGGSTGSPPPAREAPPGDLGPRYTVVWGSFPEPDREFALTVEVYPWADAGPRLHVPGGQLTFMGFAVMATPGFSDRTVEGWYPLTASALETLLSAGLPTRAELKESAESPSVAPKDVAGPAGPGLPLAVAAAAVALGGITFLARRRRHPLGRAAVLPA